MLSLLAPFRATLAWMPGLLVFRCLPYAIYVSCSSRSSMLAKVGCSGLYLGLVWIATIVTPNYGSQLALVAGGMVYYMAAAYGVYRLGSALARREITGGATFSLCAFMFIIAPGLLNDGLATSPTQVLGWELALASYSYATESTKTGARAKFGECLFFLFVSQTLVFGSRGERLHACESRLIGLGRALLGITALWVGLTLQMVGTRFIDLPLDGASSNYVGVMVYGCMIFCVEYAGHSGRASLSIGLMRMLGWNIPERYHYPFLASSPEDFWRRWNRYVGAWFRLYVYLPTTRKLHKRQLHTSSVHGDPWRTMESSRQEAKRWQRLHESLRALRRAFAKEYARHGPAIASLVATFALVGLIHDVDAAIRRMELTLYWMYGFTAVSLLVLATNGARRLSTRMGFPLGRWQRAIAGLGGRAATFCLTSAAMWMLFR